MKTRSEFVAGVVYSLISHLTQMDKEITFGKTHSSTPAVGVIHDFLNEHGIDSNTVYPDYDWDETLEDKLDKLEL